MWKRIGFFINFFCDLFMEFVFFMYLMLGFVRLKVLIFRVGEVMFLLGNVVIDLVSLKL